MINYNNKRFVGIQNVESGEVSGDTIFHYWQQDDVVWATYKGGDVKFGNLVAHVNREGQLNMRYQHINQDGAIKTGQCISTPEILEDGRIRLHEKWQWTSDDGGAGESIVEEIK